MRFFAALTAASTTLASPVGAGVVLVHPHAADPFIEEIFHRVSGELRVHAIPVDEEEGNMADPSERLAADLLERTSADACIFLSWRADASVVRIWVAEGKTHPPALLDAVALQRTPDVPTMLAARAVDLLSAALKARAGPAPDVSPHSPELPVPQAREGNGDSRPSGPWFVEGGFRVFGLMPNVGTSGGPQIGLGRATSQRFTYTVWIAGPLLGDNPSNAVASARLVEALGLLDIEATVLRVRPLALGVVGGCGVHFIHAEGTVAPGIASIKSAQDTQWMVAGSAGVTGALSLSSRLTLVIGARALLLLPQPRIQVGRQYMDLSEPSVTLALTLRLSL